jgi:hypothetical protein
MKTELVKAPEVNGPVTNGGTIVPAIIADTGEKAGKRFIEFFPPPSATPTPARHTQGPLVISSPGASSIA